MNRLNLSAIKEKCVNLFKGRLVLTIIIIFGFEGFEINGDSNKMELRLLNEVEDFRIADESLLTCIFRTRLIVLDEAR